MSNYCLCDTCRKHRGTRLPVTLGGKPMTMYIDGCTANSPYSGRIVMHDGIERPTDLCADFEPKTEVER